MSDEVKGVRISNYGIDFECFDRYTDFCVSKQDDGRVYVSVQGSEDKQFMWLTKEQFEAFKKWVTGD